MAEILHFLKVSKCMFFCLVCRYVYAVSVADMCCPLSGSVLAEVFHQEDRWI